MAKYNSYINPEKDSIKKVKDGFNWWAFLFGGLWYIFNGMIIIGILAILVTYFISIVTGGLGGIVILIVLGFTANKSKEKSLIKKNWILIEDEKECFTGKNNFHQSQFTETDSQDSDEILEPNEPDNIKKEKTESSENDLKSKFQSSLKSSFKK